jgi:hypothetical protein
MDHHHMTTQTSIPIDLAAFFFSFFSESLSPLARDERRRRDIDNLFINHMMAMVSINGSWPEKVTVITEDPHLHHHQVMSLGSV